MALRGTTSVEDIITDSVAEPEKLDPEWIPKCIRNQASGPLYAHAGIKAAADAVLEVLLSSCPCHCNVPKCIGGSWQDPPPCGLAAESIPTGSNVITHLYGTGALFDNLKTVPLKC